MPLEIGHLCPFVLALGHIWAQKVTVGQSPDHPKPIRSQLIHVQSDMIL